MKAKVIKPFDGCPDGEPQPRRFNEGDEVSGDLASVAVREGWATEIEAELFEGESSRPARSAPRKKK